MTWWCPVGIPQLSLSVPSTPLLIQTVMAPLTTTFSLLLAIAQAAASLESLSPRLNDGDIQHVALKRTPRNKNNDMSRFSRIADNLRVKYNYKSPKPISKRGNTGVVSIINQVTHTYPP